MSFCIVKPQNLLACHSWPKSFWCSSTIFLRFRKNWPWKRPAHSCTEGGNISATSKIGKKEWNYSRVNDWRYFHYHQRWSFRIYDGNTNHQSTTKCHPWYARHQDETSLCRKLNFSQTNHVCCSHLRSQNHWWSWSSSFLEIDQGDNWRPKKNPFGTWS